jgi:hypothetical protein
MNKTRRIVVLISGIVLSSSVASVLADEGMWRYNAPPRQVVARKTEEKSREMAASKERAQVALALPICLAFGKLLS